MISATFIGGPADGRIQLYDCEPGDMPQAQFVEEVSIASRYLLQPPRLLVHLIQVWRDDRGGYRYFYVLQGMDEEEVKARVNRQI